MHDEQLGSFIRGTLRYFLSIKYWNCATVRLSNQEGWKRSAWTDEDACTLQGVKVKNNLYKRK